MSFKLAHEHILMQMRSSVYGREKESEKEGEIEEANA
jgi:hypothetical protein